MSSGRVEARQEIGECGGSTWGKIPSMRASWTVYGIFLVYFTVDKSIPNPCSHRRMLPGLL